MTIHENGIAILICSDIYNTKNMIENGHTALYLCVVSLASNYQEIQFLSKIQFSYLLLSLNAVSEISVTLLNLITSFLVPLKCKKNLLQNAGETKKLVAFSQCSCLNDSDFTRSGNGITFSWNIGHDQVFKQ